MTSSTTQTIAYVMPGGDLVIAVNSDGRCISRQRLSALPTCEGWRGNQTQPNRRHLMLASVTRQPPQTHSPSTDVTVEIGNNITQGHELLPGLILTQSEADTTEHPRVRVDGADAILVFDDANYGVQILCVPRACRISKRLPSTAQLCTLVGNAAAARRVAHVLPTLQSAWAH